MKKFNGKALYNPAGKAGEYAAWACNFYVGCSNGCEYCYLKKGRGKAILGGDHPVLKKCFKDECDALKVFEKEVLANLDELRWFMLDCTLLNGKYYFKDSLVRQACIERSDLNTNCVDRDYNIFKHS